MKTVTEEEEEDERERERDGEKSERHGEMGRMGE